MKKYTVLENNGVKIAVPQGFSWPAFLLPWVWGFYKKLMVAWSIYIAIYAAAMAVYVCQTKTSHDLQFVSAATKKAAAKAAESSASLAYAYTESTNIYTTYIQSTNALAAAAAEVFNKSKVYYTANTNAVAHAEAFARSWYTNRLNNYSNDWASATQAATYSDACVARYNTALENYRNARDAYNVNASTPNYAYYSAALDRARDALNDAEASAKTAQNSFTASEAAAELVPRPTTWDTNYTRDYNNTLNDDGNLSLAKWDFDTACSGRDQANLVVKQAVVTCNQAYATYTNAVAAANAAVNVANTFSGRPQIRKLNTKLEWLSVAYFALTIGGIIAHVFFGMRGHKWVEAYFIKNGFKVVGTTWANNKKEALINIKLNTQPPVNL